ncbi:MAG: VOC family protein, partial [Nitrososphaeraceae archaeon]
MSEQIMRIDHVAIAVMNIEQAIENFKKVLKIDNMKIEEVSNEKVKVAILNLEDTRIELMEPTSE